MSAFALLASFYVIFFILFVYECLLEWISVYHMCAVPTEDRRCQISRTGVTDSLSWKSNLNSLEEKTVILTTESFSQPLISGFYFYTLHICPLFWISTYKRESFTVESLHVYIINFLHIPSFFCLYQFPSYFPLALFLESWLILWPNGFS